MGSSGFGLRSTSHGRSYAPSSLVKTLDTLEPRGDRVQRRKLSDILVLSAPCMPRSPRTCGLPMPHIFFVRSALFACRVGSRPGVAIR